MLDKFFNKVHVVNTPEPTAHELYAKYYGCSVEWAEELENLDPEEFNFKLALVYLALNRNL